MDRGSLNGGASVVVDLSAHAATLARTARTRSTDLEPDPPPALPLLDQLEADLARFDGHPDTADAFAAAGARARALAAAGGGGNEALRSAALAYAADTLTGLYQRMHGAKFSSPDPDLGEARVATLAAGPRVGSIGSFEKTSSSIARVTVSPSELMPSSTPLSSS